jgi:predicted nuclease with TOPRIM domain
VASLLFGRRAQRSASSAVRGVGRSFKEQGDVRRAEERLEAVREDRRELEEKLEEETDKLEERFDPLTEKLETVAVEPRRSDVEVERVALLWAPAGWRPAAVS